jgi:hypothetical protein
VDRNVGIDAVIVTLPVNALEVRVVGVRFWTRNGPSFGAYKATDHDLALGLVPRLSILRCCLPAHATNRTSADWSLLTYWRSDATHGVGRLTTPADSIVTLDTRIFCAARLKNRM